MKKLVNKKLGWIAEATSSDGYWFKLGEIKEKLFTQSELYNLGFEEVKEPTISDNILGELFDMNDKLRDLTESEVRTIIEENCPLIKKFTRDDVLKYVNKTRIDTTYGTIAFSNICDFLEEYNLLLSEY